MKELKACCCLDDVIRWFEDAKESAPISIHRQIQDRINFFVLLKQFRAKEQPTQKIKRNLLEKEIRRYKKEITDSLKGYYRITFPYAGDNMWSDYAMPDKLLTYSLLMDLKSYLDTGRDWETNILDEIYGPRKPIPFNPET